MNICDNWFRKVGCYLYYSFFYDACWSTSIFYFDRTLPRRVSNPLLLESLLNKRSIAIGRDNGSLGFLKEDSNLKWGTSCQVLRCTKYQTFDFAMFLSARIFPNLESYDEHHLGPTTQPHKSGWAIYIFIMKGPILTFTNSTVIGWGGVYPNHHYSLNRQKNFWPSSTSRGPPVGWWLRDVRISC